MGLLTFIRKLYHQAVPVPDLIHIHHLELLTHIGVPDEERASPQVVRADITLTLKNHLSGLNDSVDKTVDYAKVVTRLKYVAQQKPRKLIETLAEDCALAILRSHPNVQYATVEIKKFILPETDYVSVRVSLPVRNRCFV